MVAPRTIVDLHKIVKQIQVEFEEKLKDKDGLISVLTAKVSQLEEATKNTEAKVDLDLSAHVAKVVMIEEQICSTNKKLKLFEQDTTAANLATMKDQLKEVQDNIATFELKINPMISADVVAVHAQLSQAKEKAKEVELFKAQLDKDFPALKAAVSGAVEGVKSKLNPFARQVVRNEFITYREEEERRANVMVYNLPEADNINKDEARDDDIRGFLDITETCETAFKREDVVKATRLGKKNDDVDKPRPLLLRLTDEQKKRKLFKNLHLWRAYQQQEKAEDDDSPFITVAHDMSQEQRSERKALLDEATKQTDELPAESPFRFLVRGPPWMMKVVKVRKQKK